jgi:hypothetical protein
MNEKFFSAKGLRTTAILSQPCWFLILFKIIYFAGVSAALLVWPMGNEVAFFRRSSQLWTPDAHLALRSHFVSWDAEHYLRIAAQGYRAGEPQCAFYPLFPFAIRCFSIFTGGDLLVAGMILANAFSLTGELLFFTVVRRRFGESVALHSLALLLAFPGSLFFQFIYSEGLFFFLLMLLVYALDEERTTLGCIASLFLPLTRAVGIFALGPIFYHVFIKAPPAWLTGLIQRSRRARILFAFVAPRTSAPASTQARPVKAPSNNRYWLLLAPVLGWAVYFLQMQAWTGNPFEGFDAQMQMGFESIGNIFNLPHFAHELITPTSLHEITGSFLDRCSFLLLAYCLLVVWRLDKSWLLWTLLLGFVPALSGMFVSYTRFASVVFPLFVGLAVFLQSRSRASRCLLTCIACVFGVLHLILLWRFLNYHWAG